MASSLPDSLSPDSIDTLTELASILSRLRPQPDLPNSNNNNDNNGGPGAIGTGATPAPQAGAVTGTTPLPSSIAAGGTSAAGAGTGAGATSSLALALKDVPTATDGLKHKLQRARAQIRELPDMNRTVAEQEAEAEELERRIATQREVLRGLREVGMKFASEEEGAGGGGGGGDVAMRD